MEKNLYIFEIPIYRCPEDEFDKKFAQDLAEHYERIWPGGAKDRLPRETVLSAEQHYWETYGGPWNYNQTVGWLGVYIKRPLIRCDLWFTRAKRILRNPKRRKISLLGNAFQLQCMGKESSIGIYHAVLEELKLFQKDFRGGRFVLDLQCFNNVGPYIEWRSLMGYDVNESIHYRLKPIA